MPINFAKFQKRFFIDLVKFLQIYGELFVTEDGNIYVRESQAINHIQPREKLARINGEEITEMRYAKVTILNPPADSAELDDMFEEQFRARRKARKDEREGTAILPNTPTMSDEEAEAILKGKTSKEDKESIIISDTAYTYKAVLAAMRATVAPKMSGNTGFEKVKAAFEALAPEEKVKVEIELTK